MAGIEAGALAPADQFGTGTSTASSRPDLDSGPGRLAIAVFLIALAGGIVTLFWFLNRDISAAHVPALATGAVLLLGLALVIALGFEFVNGFHDTANAVATVIYTHALPPTLAVVWAGVWNFLGVLFASGAVAYGIIQLLPVELILQAGQGQGFAMVFALLIAAIVWNLGTWFLGLPSSSSHTLIGSILGVGIANQLMHYASGTSGVDWGKAQEIGLSLLISPLLGFVIAGALLLLLKRVVKVPALYQEPVGKAPPPFWIRCLLILTCTLVSFFHGSNDGQKGMGLVMLILIGAVPAAYAINRDIPDAQFIAFAQSATQAERALLHQSHGVAIPANPRDTVTHYLQDRQLTPDTVPALAGMIGGIGRDIRQYGAVAAVPADKTAALRGDMYITSEALRVLMKGPLKLDGADKAAVDGFKKGIDGATRFIPTWVKIVIAIALGLGTMVGWKRIVVTVGEKIGKAHLTYAQGASAELTTAAMIGVADGLGLPVSTTHVLSSGVAGTMAANGSGVQMGTIRALATAWALTLPASMAISGVLFWLFSQLA
ncbi:MAG: anion permease [Alphaproteobacteria bacterium PA4]|nr:MAG: anion permease [Alphaproteobacteria bacterium PA4]